MSVSDTHQILELLREIEQLLSSVETKSATVERDLPKLEVTLQTFRQIERLALRWLAIAKRMGLPEDVDGAITKMAQLITTIRMLQISMSLMYATNPLTAAIGIAGLVGSVITFQDVMAGY